MIWSRYGTASSATVAHSEKMESRMDSITQALLGATVQASLLGRWQGRKALLYGAVLGTLPDLDVVIDYGDAIADMTYHRGFSHSLFVLSSLAVALAWLARRIRPDPNYSGMRLFLTIWLVLVTHVLLDAFTSYGTQLFWPLTTPPALTQAGTSREDAYRLVQRVHHRSSVQPPAAAGRAGWRDCRCEGPQPALGCERTAAVVALLGLYLYWQADGRAARGSGNERTGFTGQPAVQYADAV